MVDPFLPGELRLRILLGSDIAMGPGKADLLEAIRRTGSISAAGRELGMSYRRAWNLVDTMNKSFRTPLVSAAKGGLHGGGTSITPFGEEVLARYRNLLVLAAQILAPEVRAFKAECLLKPATTRRK